MNSESENTKLYVSFSTDLDRPGVQVYGTPKGLLELASQLIEIANLDQEGKDIRDPAVHFHVSPGHASGLLAQSTELTIGRMDHRLDGSTAWFEAELDPQRERLDHSLRAIAKDHRSFPDNLTALETRTGMFLQRVTYDSVAACVQGYDMGTDFRFLDGFKEWLCSRTKRGHNMGWSVLVLFIAFPESPTPWTAVGPGTAGGQPDSEQHAIATLFDCLKEFCLDR